MNPVEKLGDNTSHSTTPDFESGKGYYWMKQIYNSRISGVHPATPLPRKPRRTLAERSFFDAVDRRLSRSSTVVNISFDSEGRRIHE